MILTEAKGIKFEAIRKYISKISKVSICIKETSQYDNYISIKDVPEIYDSLFVYGIGLIESEFNYNEKREHYVETNADLTFIFSVCIEIVLSKVPRTDIYT